MNLPLACLWCLGHQELISLVYDDMKTFCFLAGVWFLVGNASMLLRVLLQLIFLYTNELYLGDCIPIQPELGTTATLVCGHPFGDESYDVTWNLRDRTIARQTLIDSKANYWNVCVSDRCSLIFPTGECLRVEKKFTLHRKFWSVMTLAGELEIASVEFDNEGDYQCRASSQAGPTVSYNEYLMVIQGEKD